ncbi:MAG: SDR family NAD(P)-dependent oxidoreductase [Janthinobacterium lividum]
MAGQLAVDAEINLVRLNVESTVHLAKYALKHIVAKGSGKILITASIVSEMVAPRELVYSASKAFDLAFSKGLRAELKDTGVTVTALQPGPADTNFFDREDLHDTYVGTKGKKASARRMMWSSRALRLSWRPTSMYTPQISSPR